MSCKILIADDEPNILISLEYLMKREGYTVSVARNGAEALYGERRKLIPWMVRVVIVIRGIQSICLLQ